MKRMLPRRVTRLLAPALLAGLLTTPSHAHASFLHGEALDSLANGIAWFALVLAPIVLITVFWLVHVLPEKIAHKKGHPQTGAIQCLCLLSLAFGGLLWPIAWLWAYSKPVFYKMGYGTDVADDHHQPEAAPLKAHVEKAPAPKSPADELATLRVRVAELEAQIKA